MENNLKPRFRIHGKRRIDLIARRMLIKKAKGIFKEMENRTPRKVIQKEGEDNKTEVVEDRLDFTQPPLEQQHLDALGTGMTAFFEKDQDFIDDDDDNAIEDNEEHDKDEHFQR